VIVGKGIHSKQGPVLKNAVKEYLHDRSIRFTQSKLSDGGEGALEVFASQ
jgi:DNA-nicking Smr family endonuclease